jgi:hypothetical protein
MNLDDVLGRTTQRVTSTAKSAADLGSDSAVEATGAATRVVERSSKSPAFAAAMLALAALGGIVAMRFVFAGAVS